VTLAPQRSAHPEIRWPDPATVDGCARATVDGYRVYLPDETASVFVAAPLDVCSAAGVGVALVKPVVLA
jgi:hypothetical protein